MRRVRHSVKTCYEEGQKIERLSVKHLCLWRGRTQILKDVTLDFIPNRITAIVGPSGCGKSTLLRALNRMTDLEADVKTTGSIMYGGVEVLSLPKSGLPWLRRSIGLISQVPSPFPMSIYRNVACAIRLHERVSAKEEHRRVTEALEACGLLSEVSDRLDMSAQRLSGGQQQRLCIARALAAGPQILLFDEPTASLDPISTEKVERLIISLKRRMTVVGVTHDHSQARRCADLAARMWDGDVIEYGRAGRIIV